MRVDPLTVGAIALVGIGGITSFLDSNRQTRSAQSADTEAAKVSMRIETEARSASKKLAETRLQSGLCLVAQNPIAPGQMVKGVKIGSIVCDRYGNTAIVGQNGALLQLAQTDDKQIVQEGIE